MMRSALKFAGAAVVTALLATATPATAQVTPSRGGLVGGPGGGAFEHRCGPGKYLTGFHVRVGASVDAIGPVCSTWNPTLRRMEAHEPPPRFFGGTGGARLLTYRCAADAVVKSLTAQSAENEWRSLSYVLAFCQEARPPYRRIDQGLIRGENNHTYFPATAECDGDSVAVGLRGRAGNLVDAVGVICGPRPPLPPSPADAMRQGSGFAGPDDRARTGMTAPAAGIAPPPGSCRSGFVWRQSHTGDTACVTPESRTLARQENANAAARVDPAGVYGPATCIPGFVWREAFDGDVVCVTPERRSAVREENRLAPTRTH